MLSCPLSLHCSVKFQNLHLLLFKFKNYAAGYFIIHSLVIKELLGAAA
jgi:hypothetical protein